MSILDRIMATEFTPKGKKWDDLKVGDFVNVKDTIGHRVFTMDGVRMRVPRGKYKILGIWKWKKVALIDVDGDELYIIGWDFK